jgi:peptidyl-prolyl cis-trans isomerase C
MNSKTLLVSTAIVAMTLVARAADSANTNAEPVKTAATVTASNPNEVVAKVNGKEIKRGQLDLATKAIRMQYERAGRTMTPDQLAELDNDVLNEMISRELVLQAGQANPPTNLTEQVTQQMDAIKAQIGGEKELEKALQESGISLPEYTERMRENLIIQNTIKKIVDQRAKVTPEEVKEFYDKNPKEFEMPELAHASHILIQVPKNASDADKAAAKAKIEAARSLVKNGEKFADVAKKFSEDPGSKEKGGDLGEFPRGMMVPAFDEAVFSVATNTLSDVVTTPFGYHVIMVHERKPAHQATLDEVKQNIERYLQMQKGQKVAMEYAKELRSKAKVEVFLKPAPKAEEPKKPTPAVETPPVAAPAK